MARNCPAWIYSADGEADSERIHRARDLTIDGILYPAAIFTTWSVAQLAAIGVYRVAPALWDQSTHRLVGAPTYTRSGDHFQQVVEVEAIPEPTPEEIAARVAGSQLTPMRFWAALDAFLLAAGSSHDDVMAHVKSLIGAATAADEADLAANPAKLEAGEARFAMMALNGAAQTIPRVDPDAATALGKGADYVFLDRLAGIPGLGLAPAQVDAIFAAAGAA